MVVAVVSLVFAVVVCGCVFCACILSCHELFKLGGRHGFACFSSLCEFVGQRARSFEQFPCHFTTRHDSSIHQLRPLRRVSLLLFLPSNGQDYLVYTEDSKSKMHQRGLYSHAKKEKVMPIHGNTVKPERDIVRLYQKYVPFSLLLPKVRPLQIQSVGQQAHARNLVHRQTSGG